MNSNSYNSIHIVTESVIMGAVSMYFYKKISDLETVVDGLQQQVATQNYQIAQLQGAQRRSVSSRENGEPHTSSRQGTDSSLRADPSGIGLDCPGGVCKLGPPSLGGAEKKVVISKISKQAEFDDESFRVNYPFKVSTFKKTSPNPVIKSVTPKPSESETVDQILNEINNE